MTRYLTKSRFKLALECPTKLYYTRKEEYKDNTLEDDFLKALASQGHQVGALAQRYYPGGYPVDTLNSEEALRITEEKLKQENVIIYEAAFRYKDLFIRTDIINKKGNLVELIEVKAKSFTPNEDSDDIKSPTSKWKPYVYDVAFQKYVLEKAHPEFSVQGYLFLADKTKQATVEGLNQMFLIRKDNNGRVEIEDKPGELGEEVMSTINLDETISGIHEGTESIGNTKLKFGEYLEYLSSNYKNDKRIDIHVSRECKKCQFKNFDNEGLKSGFHECWKKMEGLSVQDLKKPLIFEINKLHFTKTDTLIGDKKFFLEKVQEEDLKSKSSNGSPHPGLTQFERQCLQVQRVTANSSEIYFDKEGFTRELEKFESPYYFIDFETTRVAIPFNIGRKPYEIVAFQYSVHKMENDWIEHFDQWIEPRSGHFPNFDFVRNLKKALGNDGTIFMYSPHENTVLTEIHDQLSESKEEDKIEMMEWIRSITSKKDGKPKKLLWCGERKMVDMLELIKWFYYHPNTRGSNSIKDVLPAVLESSQYLQDYYSRPVYGSEIKSMNHEHPIAWIVKDENGKLISPYAQLPTLFKDYSRDQLDDLLQNDKYELNDGGAAMTAYHMMQFTEMSEKERKDTQAALLRYCELDTLAMVMIWQYFIKTLN